LPAPLLAVILFSRYEKQFVKFRSMYLVSASATIVLLSVNDTTWVRMHSTKKCFC